LQLPRFAVALGDLDHPIRLRVIGPGSQVSPDVRQEAFDTLGLNIGKRLPIETWRPTIAFRLVVGLCQGIALDHMPKEPPEPMRFVRLRLPVYPPS